MENSKDVTYDYIGILMFNRYQNEDDTMKIKRLY